MKKRFSILLSVLLSISLLFPLTSCVGSKTISVSESSENTASDTASDYVTPASDFEYKENEDGITITKYIGDSTEVVIPETINGKPVTVIGTGFLSNSKNGTRVVHVRMPDTITVIDKSAFENCTALFDIQLSNQLRSIGAVAFKGCTGLQEITFPESMTEIGAEAFLNCTALKELILPDQIAVLGEGCFGGAGLEKITFSENSSLECIPSGCFSGTPIKELTLPSNIKKIDFQAFGYCAQLETIRLNDGLEYVSYQAFCGNLWEESGSKSSLREIVIPSSVTFLAKDAFLGCDRLEQVFFEGNAPNIYIGPDVEDLSTFIVCYHEGATGFDSDDWQYYQKEIW